MVSTSVFSEWTKVGGDDNTTTYVDLGTIEKKDHKVKLSSLLDYKTTEIFIGDNYSYFSQESRNEYDCEEETSRQLDWYLYSGNMRQGKIVNSHVNIQNKSRSIFPGGFNETFFKIACGKK